VWRQANYLRSDYQISVAGLGDPGLEDVEWLPVDRIPPKNFMHRCWRAGALLAGYSTPFLKRYALRNAGDICSRQFDVVLVNDVEPLPLGFALSKGAPVVFDAHEYYPRNHEESLFWCIFHKRHVVRLCSGFIPRCSAMTTVSPGLVEEYSREYGVVPQIIYSAPPRLDIAPQPSAPDRVRLIHHGGASSGRKIEDMICMMDMLDSRFSLDLMLVGKGEYYSKLQDLAAKRSNVGWCHPVPMPEIARSISSYDMGLYLMPDTNFNHRVAIPNKLFEFIQARLAIAVSPIQGMANIVRKHDIGVVSKDFRPESMARALNALTAEDIARFKQNVVQAAAEFTAENEMDKLRKLLRSLLH
jgi:hypothetical protein